MSELIDVVIIGAGPVGLTLANQLRRYNVSCRVYEETLEKPKISKAFSIHSRSIELLSQLGIKSELHHYGRAIRRMNIYSDKQRIAQVDFKHLNNTFPYFISIPQYILEDLLEQKLWQRQGRIERGNAFVSLEKYNNNIETQLRNKNGDTKCVRSRYLVACDGSHSSVRKHLNIPFTGDTYDSEFMVADAHLSWEGNNFEGHTFLSAQGYVMVMPFPGELHRVVIDVPTNYFNGEEPTLEQVHKLLAQRGHDDMRISSPEWLSSTRYHRRLAKKFRDGNVFLAGDACHIHSPMGGQGLNTGIQDSINLGWKLALVCNGTASDSILSSYESERKAVARDVLASTDKMTKNFSSKNPIKSSVRKILMPIATRSPKVQTKLVGNISGLNVYYQNTFKYGNRELKRAPDCLFESHDSKQYLHKIFDVPGFHLLVFAGKKIDKSLKYKNIAEPYLSTLSIHYVVDSGPVDDKENVEHIIIDRDQKLKQTYQAKVGDYYLLRPDGYIAKSGDESDDSDLIDYLEELFPAQRAKIVNLT